MFKALSRPLPDLKDWRFSVDQWGIGWAEFDREGESQNSLGRRPLEELAQIVAKVEEGARDKSIRGLVIISAKERGFIVGADIREFADFTTEFGRHRKAAPCHGAVRSHRAAAGSGRLRHQRLLPRRRPRAGACLPLPHRHARQRHQARLPRGQARHLPRLQRHGALDPPGGGPGRHAGDVDGQDAVRFRRTRHGPRRSAGR